MSKENTVVMTKKIVKFAKADGKTPTRHGLARSFNLLAPLDVALIPGVERTIDLGLSCDHPVHILPAKGPTDRGVKLVGGTWASTDAGSAITIRVHNTSTEVQHFSEGETLARCTVLDDSEWEIG